jgi:hypothetical protein
MPLGSGGRAYNRAENGLIVGRGSGGDSPTRPTPIFDLRTAVTYANAANNTYTVNDILSGLILRDCNGAPRTDTLPTATQIRDALVSSTGCLGLVVGSALRIHIRNTTGTAQTLTIAVGSGGTGSGTLTIAQSNAKDFLLVFTNVSNSPAYTLYSLGTVVF